MKLAIFSAQKYEESAFRSFSPSTVELHFFDASLNIETAVLAKGCDAVCVFVNDTVDKAVITQLADLGVGAILLRCAGFNNVDLAAAQANHIRVARVPAYSPEAVAEHCLALILTLTRHTHKAYNRVRDDNFDLNGLVGFNLHKKTIGLIGCGKIGQALVNILNGFGMNVLVSDPTSPSGHFTLVDTPTLLAQSDIVSLHCPLTEQTHHIINDQALATMKRGAMLLNTSRGALVDARACIDALKSGQLGYLAMDVYEQESELFFKNRSEEVLQDDVFARLMSFKNVLITGHQGFLTQEAINEIATTTFLNLNEYAQGKALSNEVIPIALIK